MIETTASRRESLDALRAAAMLLGVVLHALIAYMQTPVPHLLWPVREPSGSGFDAVYWWIHGFRIELFFWLAGLFASESLVRSGPAVFARHRLKRLGLPLMAGTIFVVGGLMYPIWALGWVRSGAATPMQVLHVRFDHGMQQDLYGVAHLWFVEYLLCYSLLLAAWRRWGPRSRASTWASSRSGVFVATVVLIALTAVWHVIDPRCLIEFHNWFTPRLSEFAHHGVFFVAGVIASRSPMSLAFMSRWWWIMLGAAQCVAPWFVAAAQAWSSPGAWTPALLAATYAWASIFGWVGMAMALIGTRRAIVGCLARRAYWIYVMHPPLVGAVQVGLYGTAIPAWGKAAIAAVTAVMIASMTYAPFVRAVARVSDRLGRRADRCGPEGVE